MTGSEYEIFKVSVSQWAWVRVRKRPSPGRKCFPLGPVTHGFKWRTDGSDGKCDGSDYKTHGFDFEGVKSYVGSDFQLRGSDIAFAGSDFCPIFSHGSNKYPVLNLKF